MERGCDSGKNNLSPDKPHSPNVQIARPGLLAVVGSRRVTFVNMVPSVGIGGAGPVAVSVGRRIRVVWRRIPIGISPTEIGQSVKAEADIPVPISVTTPTVAIPTMTVPPVTVPTMPIPTVAAPSRSPTPLTPSAETASAVKTTTVKTTAAAASASSLSVNWRDENE
jgi:hypothetical protein